jgi:F-type H+-transporting ATPase subunit a
VAVVGLLLFISSGFLANLGIGTLLPEPVLPTILLPAEPITATTEILGFKTGFTNTLLATLLADMVLVTLAFYGTRKLRSGDESAMVPSGLQNLLEAIVEGLYNLAEGILGTRARKVFWLGATIFLFVLVANWMELIPGFDSVGWLEHPHEEGITAYQRSELGPIGILKGPAVEPAESDHNESGEGHQAEGWVLVPFLRAANTDLNTTLALAVISVVMTQVYSIQALGLNGYLGKFIQTKRSDRRNCQDHLVCLSSVWKYLCRSSAAFCDGVPDAIPLPRRDDFLRSGALCGRHPGTGVYDVNLCLHLRGDGRTW